MNFDKVWKLNLHMILVFFLHYQALLQVQYRQFLYVCAVQKNGPASLKIDIQAAAFPFNRLWRSRKMHFL